MLSRLIMLLIRTIPIILAMGNNKYNPWSNLFNLISTIVSPKMQKHKYPQNDIMKINR